LTPEQAEGSIHSIKTKGVIIGEMRFITDLLYMLKIPLCPAERDFSAFLLNFHFVFLGG
jgi:hypothetical protein